MLFYFILFLPKFCNSYFALLIFCRWKLCIRSSTISTLKSRLMWQCVCFFLISNNVYFVFNFILYFNDAMFGHSENFAMTAKNSNFQFFFSSLYFCFYKVEIFYFLFFSVFRSVLLFSMLLIVSFCFCFINKNNNSFY